MDKNNSNRRVIFSVGLIISFALLIISVSLYYSLEHQERTETKLSPEKVKDMSNEEVIKFLETRQANTSVFHSFYLLPFVGFIGLLVGTLVYYMMSEKAIIQEKSLEKNTKIILNFLTAQEKKVIETLLENDGRVQQYELSHLPNLNKVKTHRILLNLEQKGIIHKEKLGKINKIVLNKELYEVLR